MIQCPHCSSSEHQTKSGHTRTGSQRYRCKECQRIYTPEPKPLGYPEETKREAVRLYLEGTNFRRIGRILSVNHQSVVNWVNATTPTCPPPSSRSPRPRRWRWISCSPSSAQKNASLHRNPCRSGDALHRGVGGLLRAHAGVDAVRGGLGAARRQLLL